MDIFFEIFLLTSNKIVLVPLTVIGFIFFNRKAWGQALCLYLFTMMFVYTLKIIFKVPLDPAFGVGKYVFPSGVMQSTFVYFGWLFLQTSSQKYKGLITFILAGIACGLLYFGYVGIFDILGAIGFGIVTLYFFNRLAHMPKYKDYPAKTGGILWGIFILLFVLVGLVQGKVALHLWLPFFAFPGFVLSWSLFEKDINNKTFPMGRSILILFTILASALLLNGLMSVFPITIFPPFIINIPWFLIGGCLPFYIKLYK